MRPVTVFLLVWGVIDTFQFFDLVFTTTRGGPLRSTITLVYYVWELAFNFFTAGYGAAVAYVLFFASLAAIIVGLVYARKRGWRCERSHRPSIGLAPSPGRCTSSTPAPSGPAPRGRAAAGAGAGRFVPRGWHLVLLPLSVIMVLPFVWMVSPPS